MKREKIIRLNESLITYMEGNFYATNKLSGVCNTYMGTRFSDISIRRESSVKDNCNRLIERIHEIQGEIEKLNAKLKEELSPDIYYKLQDENLSLNDRLKAAYKYISGSLRITASISYILTGCFIISALCSVCSILTVIAVSVVGVVLVGALFIGVDMVISAILGARERDQLDSTIAEYEKCLDEFKPASRQYQTQIQRVMFLVEEKLQETLKL